ncbi:hypothetical protein PIB30_030422 [Stylosanthes scabra]|uniref:Uncharacterized protein n=1 Tax=Stylosanthes scabra TaxID=79078 RepID=A0ABU6QB71_9FABA|nr:hypothetical protein [Stylosanthes scabra]
MPTPTQDLRLGPTMRHRSLPHDPLLPHADFSFPSWLGSDSESQSTAAVGAHTLFRGIGISPHLTSRGPDYRLTLIPFSEFVCLPYRTLEVEVVLNRSILQEDHRALWCSIVPLIYFGTIEWHQVDRVIPQQAFLEGLSSPGFQHFISDMLQEGDGGYRPDTQFDGSQVHLDLNESMSGPSHMFMTLGGTPPSAAHVPGGSWNVPFMEPARLPTPPASLAPTKEPDEPAAQGRARK